MKSFFILLILSFSGIFLIGCVPGVVMQTAEVLPKNTIRGGGAISFYPKYDSLDYIQQGDRHSDHPDDVAFTLAPLLFRYGLGNRVDVGASLMILNYGVDVKYQFSDLAWLKSALGLKIEYNRYDNLVDGGGDRVASLGIPVYFSTGFSRVIQLYASGQMVLSYYRHEGNDVEQEGNYHRSRASVLSAIGMAMHEAGTDASTSRVSLFLETVLIRDLGSSFYSYHFNFGVFNTFSW